MSDVKMTDDDRAAWSALVAEALRVARLAAAAQHDLSAWRERLMVKYEVPAGHGLDPVTGAVVKVD